MSEKLGRYECLKTIGKGGMGEVLLAYDPICDRRLALKRIRPDLKQHESLKNRFLREAKLTAQLTHPGIISIYSIHQEEGELYYTMPYVEGETFRQILRQEMHHPRSIAALLPIFKSICQTVAYIHSKGILHRDLKPENILVGKFGEVIILDWGLAQLISEPLHESHEEIAETPADLTSPGKLVGTVAYMAPERALGAPASIKTDIYALGVMLYQILTLQLPFERPSIKEFRKILGHEKLADPEEAAPYREVPPRLSRIVKKCLEADPEKRYANADELIEALMGHMEGRSEWYESARLNVRQKKHWEFQENVLISKHIAITRTPEEADWVSIMVSKKAFAENTRLQTRICIGEHGAGIGFLLSIPETDERESPFEGYCLWLGAGENTTSQLFRNTVEVMQFPELHLKRGSWHTVVIEKIDNNIRFYLDGKHHFTHISYLPIYGMHVGILARDADYQMEEIEVSIGSQNLQVSCLSVPDAFLSHRDYKSALAEYRRIGYSFPGHAEGREAMFRAGVTLLEQAKSAKNPKRAESFYTQAIEEFSKLHNTPGAPLEYLGKGLVYQALEDHFEEIKCLELGLRRYHKHPLIHALREQIIYRMHEASQTDRRSAYQFILITLRLLPEISKNEDSRRLFKHLTTHWELLPFFESSIDPHLIGKEKLVDARFATSLAFWLSAPYVLTDILKTLPQQESATIGDILYALFELGSPELADKMIQEMSPFLSTLTKEEAQELEATFKLLAPLTQSLEKGVETFLAFKLSDAGVKELRTARYLMEQALHQNQEEWVHRIASQLLPLPISTEDRIGIDAMRIWAYLQKREWKRAEEIFETYPMELLNQESTLLYTLYGCWLLVMEGEEIATIHFSGVIDTLFPRSWALLGHELTNKISESPWMNTSFMWERRALYQQLALYFLCADNKEKANYYKHLEKEEYIRVEE